MSYIYLDNAATTRVSERAAQTMLRFAREEFYNPSAGYAPALSVRRAITNAAGTIAGLLGAEAEEIVFTSCATESNCHAFACGIKNKKGNIVVGSGEHASVYECAMRLKSKGVEVRFAATDADGHVTPENVAAVTDENTAFVSVMHCSNETGTVNDIAGIAAAVRAVSPRATVHSDGVQAFCKVDTDVKKLGVDLYSVSAHKVGGPKGTGALYIRKGFNMPPFIVGGGQQGNRRSGTENVCGIASFAEAAAEYKKAAGAFDARSVAKIFTDRFSGRSDVRINGGGHTSGYVLSLSFLGLRGEIIARGMEDNGILIGLGSACSTHVRSNRVLGAMGVPKEFAEGSVRISFCPSTTREEAEYAAATLEKVTNDLRERMRR